VEHVTVTFGGIHAVEDVSFDLRQGELLGLIGPNGAGKTTTLRSITGVIRPNAGNVVLNGLDITRLPVDRRVRLGLGMSQQLVRPFREMTVEENVALAAGWRKTETPWRAFFALNRDDERREAGEMLAFVGIADVAAEYPATLPLGVLKRLEVARALALRPKVVLLDEPLAGLNQLEAARLADTIRGLVDERGLSIVLIEHNLSEVLRICDRLVVLESGRNLAAGDPRRVMADPAVRTAYLGAGHA
jgi:branched-chain amino acid transport system ATP-binding protein